MTLYLHLLVSVIFQISGINIKMCISFFKSFLFFQVISGTPYYEFLQRVNEYKSRSLESTNCGFWQDVLRLDQ